MLGWRLNRVALALSRGAVIAYPTDTIWGLGCDPLNARSVARIQNIKNRPLGKGLILLGTRPQQFSAFINPSFNTRFIEQLKQQQDKPTTWLVPVSSDCPHWLTGGSNRVAVRVTQKPLIRLLCSASGVPLVSTSANLSGFPVARNRLQVQRVFRHAVDFIIDDPLQPSLLNPAATASRIVDLQSGQIIRP